MFVFWESRGPLSRVRKLDKAFSIFKNINGIGKGRTAGSKHLYDPYIQCLNLDPFLVMVSHIPFSSILPFHLLSSSTQTVHVLISPQLLKIPKISNS